MVGLWRSIAYVFGWGAPPPPRARPIGERVGSLVRRHLEAFADTLRDKEWEQLRAIGLMEYRLSAHHDRLRSLSTHEGLAGTTAAEVRREIDVVLSEHNGLLARSVREFPARDEVRAAEAVERLRRRVSDLRSRTVELLRTQESAGRTRNIARELQECYLPIMPDACAGLGIEVLEHRLDDAITRVIADRVRLAVDECGAILAEREATLTTDITRYTAALQSMNVEAERDRAGNASAGDLEQHATELRDDVRRRARDLILADRARVVAVADQHAVHASTGMAADAFEYAEPPEMAQLQRRKSGIAQHNSDVLERWIVLRSFRVISTDTHPTDSPKDVRARARRKPSSMDVVPEHVRPRRGHPDDEDRSGKR